MADLPVIGFDSIVTATNITASAESAGFPASALGNPLTYDRFRAPVTGDSEGKVYLSSTPDRPCRSTISALPRITGHDCRNRHAIRRERGGPRDDL